MYTDKEILRRQKIRRMHMRQNKFKRNVFMLVMAIFMFTWMFNIASGSTITDNQYKLVTVESGDTLWSIANEHTDGDVREGISKIKKVNNLKSAHIEVAQVLKIPVE